MDNQEGMKNTKNIKYVRKYKGLFFPHNFFKIHTPFKAKFQHCTRDFTTFVDNLHAHSISTIVTIFSHTIMPLDFKAKPSLRSKYSLITQHSYAHTYR